MRRAVRRQALALLACGAIVCGATSSARAQQRAEKGLKVYISADMEGVAGAVSADQLLPTGFEYDRFRG